MTMTRSEFITKWSCGTGEFAADVDDLIRTARFAESRIAYSKYRRVWADEYATMKAGLEAKLEWQLAALRNENSRLQTMLEKVVEGEAKRLQGAASNVLRVPREDPYRQGTIEYAYAEVGTGLDKIPGIGISAKRSLTIYGPDLSEP